METVSKQENGMNPLQEAAKYARKAPSSGNEAAVNNNNNNNKMNKAVGRSASRSKTMKNKPISDTKQRKQQQTLASPGATATATATMATDENLPKDALAKDPRDPTQRIHRKKQSKNNKTKGGRNTESFDPESTLVRPDLRVQIGNPHQPVYRKPLKHDDVVIVPELFGPEDDWSLYYKLVHEITDLQQSNVKGSEWISWHEGAHLIVKQPSASPTFNKIIDRLCEYFSIQRKSVGTRFNWYSDSKDWKPFHHDSAAFNPSRAKNQNITVGVSFGATRELAFLRATSAGSTTENDKNNNNKPCRIYFPQTNNGVFTFGRDVNIHWKHGINALAEEEQDGKGRISIILWGKVEHAIEEKGSPALLGADGQGPHANKSSNGSNKKFHNNKNNRNNNRRQRNSDKTIGNVNANANNNSSVVEK